MRFKLPKTNTRQSDARQIISVMAMFFFSSQSYGEQEFEFRQRGTSDVLATLKVSETPITDGDSILSMILRDPLNPGTLTVADLSRTPSVVDPITMDALGLGGSGNLQLAVSFAVVSRPDWWNSRSDSLFFVFGSEPDNDAILTASLIPQLLSEGNWVLVPEPTSQILLTIASLCIVFQKRLRHII